MSEPETAGHVHDAHEYHGDEPGHVHDPHECEEHEHQAEDRPSFLFHANGRWPAPMAEVPGDETVKLIRCQTPAADSSDPGFLTPGFGPMGTVLAEQTALGCTAIPFRRRAFLAEGGEFRHCTDTGRLMAEARVEFHNSQGGAFLPVPTSRC